MRHFTNFAYLLLLVRAEAFFCNFETDLCGFTQDDSDTDDWERISYDSLASLHRWHLYNWISTPKNDHTYGNSTGYYMFIVPAIFKVARLVSRTQSVQSTNNNTVCFQFWYHMNSDSADLNMYVQVKSNVLGNPVWSRSGGRGNIWHAGEVEIQENTTYQVIIEGLGNWFRYGAIGIDDVMISNSSCQSNGNDVMNVSCSFETRNRCGYRQDQSDDFDWEVHNGAAAITDGIGPSSDHTLGTELGYYMYIFTNTYGNIAGHKARLISPLWTVTDLDQCVEFWYRMYGSDAGTLSLFIRPADGALPASPAVKRVGHHGNTWLRATHAMSMTGNFELVFEAFRGSGILGDIAIDDVLVYATPCASNTVEPTALPIEFQKADCDFDQGVCNYTQGIESDFYWRRMHGPTPTWYTGPDFDHTQGNELGYYMCMEVSYLRQPHQKARLLTPILDNKNTDTCVSFYYHMYGWGVDFLKVYKQDIGGGLPVDPISMLNGNKGNVWHYQKVDINGQTENFQIVFEGTVGKYTYQGDIAIDDIVFHNTSCDQVILLPVTNISMNCDFEDNAPLCGFIQSTTDDFDWQLRKGSTDSTATGPSADHTYGDTKGQYLYVEASSPRRPNERARVVSPLVESANHLLCLKFWYHMKGEHVGKMNLYRRLDGTGNSKQLWTMDGDQGDRWIEAWLPINYNDDTDEFIETQIQLIFEGVIGTGHLGDIAIDDIKLESHYCFQSETMDTTAAVTLLSCDFEAGITKCGFSQDLSDVFDWKISNISEGRPDIPNYSEISALQKSFAYITMAGRKKGDKANLATRTTTANGTQRCLSFKYIKVGDVQQQLNVYSLDTEDALGLIGTVPYRETKNAWESCQFKLPVDLGMSKIMFEGVVGFGQVGYIALDDVTIYIGACTDTGTISSDNDASPPEAVVQAGDDGLDVVAKLFISFTVILLCLILVSVGVIATRHKYTKRVMQREQTENQASYHYAKNPDISTDVAVSNPVYEIARLGDSA